MGVELKPMTTQMDMVKQVARTRSWRKRLNIAISFCVMVGCAAFCFIAYNRRVEPIYEGKRIGLWFGDLCIGTYARELRGEAFDSARKKMSAAEQAFSRMDSNAVSYLTAKLTSNSTIREAIIQTGRNLPLVNSIFFKLVPPSHERIFAAEALRNMGSTAEVSMPYLLKAAAKEENSAVKLRMLMALANAMGMYYSSSYQPPNLEIFEQKILDHARRYYPHLFRKMDESRTTSRR